MGRRLTKRLLRHMLQRMKYRGPDAQNIWIEGNVGLGHALYRTCEQDIEQPYTLEHVTVAAHVRVDARDELIPRLRSAGFEAALDAPDVELLAKAYLAWGEACLNYLLGDLRLSYGMLEIKRHLPRAIVLEYNLCTMLI